MNPILQDQKGPIYSIEPRPFRPESIFWVAFFGGGLACCWALHQNACRLGHRDISSFEVRLVKAFLFFEVLFPLVVLALYPEGTTGALKNAIRLGSRASGLALFLYGRFLLESYHSLYIQFVDPQRKKEQEYDSLWLPGFMAVMLLGILEKLGLYLVLGYMFKG